MLGGKGPRVARSRNLRGPREIRQSSPARGFAGASAHASDRSKLTPIPGYGPNLSSPRSSNGDLSSIRRRDRGRLRRDLGGRHRIHRDSTGPIAEARPDRTRRRSPGLDRRRDPPGRGGVRRGLLPGGRSPEPKSADLGRRRACRTPRRPRPGMPVEVVHPGRAGSSGPRPRPASVHAFEHAALYAKVSGYLKVQNVDIGDRVKRGQLLAVIEDPEVDKAVDQNQAALDQARAKVRVAEAKIRSAQAAKEAAEAMVKVSDSMVAAKVSNERPPEEAIEAGSPASSPARLWKRSWRTSRQDRLRRGRRRSSAWPGRRSSPLEPTVMNKAALDRRSPVRPRRSQGQCRGRPRPTSPGPRSYKIIPGSRPPTMAWSRSGASIGATSSAPPPKGGTLPVLAVSRDRPGCESSCPSPTWMSRL